jgi:hypothetical protein
VTDVDGILEIECCGDFGDIRRVGFDVVASHGLSGTAVAAAIMRNYAITTIEEEHHLGVPVVGR